MSEIYISHKDRIPSPERPEDASEVRRTWGMLAVSALNDFDRGLFQLRSKFFSESKKELSSTDMLIAVRREAKNRRAAQSQEFIDGYVFSAYEEPTDDDRDFVEDSYSRITSYLNKNGRSTLQKVYERNKNKDFDVVHFKGALQGISLDFIEKSLAFHEQVQNETLVDFGFRPEKVLTHETIASQIKKNESTNLGQRLSESIQDAQKVIAPHLKRGLRIFTQSALMVSLLVSDVSGSPHPFDDTPPLRPVPSEVTPTVTPTEISSTPTPATESVSPVVINTATAIAELPPVRRTVEPTVTPAVETAVPQPEYYRFGKIELGSATESGLGKPIVMFIRLRNSEVIKLYMLPKQLRANDPEPYNPHNPFNIVQIDGVREHGGGASLQTMHSGVSNGLQGPIEWPAEVLAKIIERSGDTPEVAIKKLLGDVVSIQIIQGDFAEGVFVDPADPIAVSNYLNGVESIEDTGFQNTVTENAQLKNIVRLSPLDVTELDGAYNDAAAIAERDINAYIPVQLHDVFSEIDLKSGDLGLIFCGRTVTGEMHQPGRGDLSQSRIIFAFSLQ